MCVDGPAMPGRPVGRQPGHARACHGAARASSRRWLEHRDRSGGRRARHRRGRPHAPRVAEPRLHRQPERWSMIGRPDTVPPGTLYGIGVGPGDPELLTLKGLRLLRSVPVIFTPVARPGARSYAREVVDQFLEPGRQEVVELCFAMRDDTAGMSRQWRTNADTILGCLQDGRDAAFLTEGDPMLYSTFVHITWALRERQPDVAVQVVPGISSIQAAAAVTEIPLADRDERMAVIPASYEGVELRSTLEAFDTVVLLKVASAKDRVLDTIEELGLTDRAVLVERCGRPEQTIIRDVRSLRGRRLDYFSLIIIRKSADVGRSRD
ncbi:MAG: precorrin-2 C(20)-methyltransferase [Chloroflexi bacterium]|nr:precorrin-2 C(20)-methyltransferase [Chloroflexota bacterium]